MLNFKREPTAVVESREAEVRRRLTKAEVDLELKRRCVEFANDPGAFTRFIYPWGEGILDGWDGPDDWHEEVFSEIKGYLEGDSDEPLCIAICSGHGAAKTAFVAWLIRWFMSCRGHPQVVCTANTESQLNTKTWRELAKWHKLGLNRDWFEWTATQYYLKDHPETWKANAIAWSENNSEAFAGTHEESVLVAFDEASKISDKIWEVTDGIFTTRKNIWVVVGNGTRNIGRFYDCFHKNRRYWKTWNIDSRTCKAANRQYLERLVEQYGGEESDEAKVRVRGLFPSRATGQLISTEAVERAQKTEVSAWEYAPKVMGVDIARFGSNQSEICIRQGRKVLPIERVPKGDLMIQSQYIADRIKKERPNLVCVDGSGMGAGVVDRLRQLGFSVMDVNGGNSSINPRFLNKRAEMWWEMKEFLELGEAELPNDKELRDHLTVVEYDFTDKGRIRLQRKDDIVQEFGFSPDKADALSLTFAYPVPNMLENNDVDPVIYEDS
jgi:hypothetical protein